MSSQRNREPISTSRSLLIRPNHHITDIITGPSPPSSSRKYPNHHSFITPNPLLPTRKPPACQLTKKTKPICSLATKTPYQKNTPLHPLHILPKHRLPPLGTIRIPLPRRPNPRINRPRTNPPHAQITRLRPLRKRIQPASPPALPRARGSTPPPTPLLLLAIRHVHRIPFPALIRPASTTAPAIRIPTNPCIPRIIGIETARVGRMRPLVGARRRPVVPVLEGAHAVVEPPDDAAGGGGGRAVGGRRRGEEGDVGGKRGRGELGGGGLAGLEVVWGRGGGGEGEGRGGRTPRRWARMRVKTIQPVAAARRRRRMTMMTTPAACIVAVVGGVVGWWWWERPRVRVRLAIATAMGSNVEIADGGWLRREKEIGRVRNSLLVYPSDRPGRARVCVGSWDGVPGKRWDGMGWSRKSRSLRLWDDMMSDTGMGIPAGRRAPQGAAAEVPTSNRRASGRSMVLCQGGQAPRGFRTPLPWLENGFVAGPGTGPFASSFRPLLALKPGKTACNSCQNKKKRNWGVNNSGTCDSPVPTVELTLCKYQGSVSSL